MNHSSTITNDVIIPMLNHIKQKGSFEPPYFPVIDSLVSTIGHLKRAGEISDADMEVIRYHFGNDFLENTLQGMALLKKYGYAGDFMMIDKIYVGNKPDDHFFRSWDDYFQNHAAPKAVRNRKAYFKKLLLDKLQNHSIVKLLNIASGPGRDMLELYAEMPTGKKIITTCVEMDKDAISYAEKLNLAYSNDIEFINKNIFKFDTDENFDVIWSAGLFDYFDDKAFVFVLNKLKNWVIDHGEIIIGNFNETNNPTREYMELFGNWYLHHRTAANLAALALSAGFEQHQITINSEEEQVNLFMHLQM
ncbi:MAG: class I SAM-dependent methyltransferase [Ferruginibacter sp.]